MKINTEKKMITLKDFRNTSQEKELTEEDKGNPGVTHRVEYLGGFYILTQKEDFHLTLGRDEYIGELAQLEVLLYNYALNEMDNPVYEYVLITKDEDGYGFTHTDDPVNGGKFSVSGFDSASDASKAALSRFTSVELTRNPL